VTLVIVSNAIFSCARPGIALTLDGILNRFFDGFRNVWNLPAARVSWRLIRPTFGCCCCCCCCDCCFDAREPSERILNGRFLMADAMESETVRRLNANCRPNKWKSVQLNKKRYLLAVIRRANTFSFDYNKIWRADRQLLCSCSASALFLPCNCSGAELKWIEWTESNWFCLIFFRLDWKQVKKFREEEDAVAIPDAVDVPRQQKQQEEEGRSSQGQPQILLHLIPSHLSHVKTLRVPSGGIWRHLEASGGIWRIAAHRSQDFPVGDVLNDWI